MDTQSINLSTIEDVTKLKALAYDEIEKLESAKFNLALIQKRIEEMTNQAV